MAQAFGYIPFDTLECIQKPLFSGKNYTDFEDFYRDFEIAMEAIIFKIKKDRTVYDPLPNPGVIASLFVEGCTEKGLDYNNLGPKYTFCGIHAGGIANASDSLSALKNIVFEKKLYSFEEYVKIIKSNWENQADLRIMALNCPKYGNDSEGDLMTQRVYNSFVTINEKIPEMKGVLFPSGISTFGRENEWRGHRKATADGHLEGEILAGNMSPSPGCDISGPTAMLKSYCKLDFSRLPNCGPLDMELDPSSLKGEEGTQAIIALNKALIDLGGIFMQINVVDKATLLDAQQNPDKHKNLSVRVSGWNARFATLDDEWQKMVINRLS